MHSITIPNQARNVQSTAFREGAPPHLYSGSPVGGGEPHLLKAPSHLYSGSPVGGGEVW
jgi:hypothetical protein